MVISNPAMTHEATEKDFPCDTFSCTNAISLVCCCDHVFLSHGDWQSSGLHLNGKSCFFWIVMFFYSSSYFYFEARHEIIISCRLLLTYELSTLSYDSFSHCQLLMLDYWNTANNGRIVCMFFFVFCFFTNHYKCTRYRYKKTWTAESRPEGPASNCTSFFRRITNKYRHATVTNIDGMHQNTPKSCLLRQKVTFFFLLSQSDRSELSCDELPRLQRDDTSHSRWKNVNRSSAQKRLSWLFSLSHGLAVVLWGRHLIVAGTEEGGVLHQVPAEKREVVVRQTVPTPG